MSLEQAAEAVTIEVMELDISPGNIIAIICPEDWQIAHTVSFGEYFEAYLKRKGIATKFVIFPFGTQLAVIKPERTVLGPIQKVEEGEEGLSSHDDGRPWGFMAEPTMWLALPKTPMLLANLGPPPFSVVLPDGEVRHIIHNPEEND